MVSFVGGSQPQGLKRVCEYSEKNRRSLHYAPPDFLSRFGALINIMRFFLRKNRIRGRCQEREVGNPGTLRSG
jgi:hypothetical protein